MPVDIEHVTPYKYDLDALKTLVIPREHKKMLEDVCEARRKLGDSKSRVTVDPELDNVGADMQGLIILLHGHPGTGKTLTAGLFKTTHNW